MAGWRDAGVGLCERGVVGGFGILGDGGEVWCRA